MRVDDEHDPLNSWLSQQVQPLPPPPGTFELISKRARRRKLRKLAVTVVSAAAVAAAVAVAVPVGLHLNLSPTPTKANYAAGDGSPTSAGHTQSPYGQATRIKTPAPSPTPTATTAPGPSGGAVPKNFQPSSVTFVSGTAGWAIGQAGTAGSCDNANPDICTSIAATNDAGQSWRGIPAPDAGAPNGASGISGIRFLNGTDGWAFGPELYSTDDGGQHWTQVGTDGYRVTDLETSDGRAYALFASCSTPADATSADFAAGCTSYTLMTATAGSDVWTAVGGATSGLTNGGGATSAVLQLTGTNGYLLAPNGTLYSGPIGGAWAQVGTANCEPGPAQADGLPADAQLALVNSTELAIACNGTSASAPPAIYLSTDGGALWTQPPAASWSDIGDLSDFGVTTSLSAAPNGTYTLATTTGIYVLGWNSERWKPSSATGSGAPQGGFSYVGMTTDEQGVALPADMSLHQVWMTFDGGATWRPVTLSS